MKLGNKESTFEEADPYDAKYCKLWWDATYHLGLH